MGWTQKLPSGKYRALYRDAFGAQHSAGTYLRKAEALRMANSTEDSVRRAMTRNPDAHKRTWGDWCEEWWTSRTVEPSTLKRDRSRRDLQLIPRWGDVPLGQITRHDIKAWAAQLRRGGGKDGRPLGNASVLRVVHLFSASLNAAVDAEIITSNPAARIKLPPAPPTKDRFLSHEEYDAIQGHLPTVEDQVIMHVLTYTGIRIGEASGLRWSRVDLTVGQLTVTETFDDETGLFKAYPKGRRARTVPFEGWLRDLLAELRFEKAGKPQALVFARPDGSPLRRSNWDNVFRRAVGATNLGPDDEPVPVEAVTIHDLRHTFCSWLAQAGVPLAQIGMLAGHESPITTQRYAHLVPTDHAVIYEALGRPGASATNLLHEGGPGSSLEQRVARSSGVGPVGIEPTTRGLKGSPQDPEG